MLSDRLEPDHVLRFKTRWRLAKAHHDQERPSDALTALDPLVEAGDPFAGYPQGLDAVGALAVEAWHRLGYADPRVDRLFVAAEAVHQATGDRVRATQARLQRLWASACRGDGDAVRAELQAFVELDPGSFESGPSRHPRAPDAAGSVAWLQLDAARTALRVATWARDPELADLAEDAFEDAATDADLDREGEIWFLEPIALVRRRLARPDPDDYARTWLDLAGRIDYPRRAYHHRVALAEAARGDDPSRLATRYREAADVALEHDHGPEWAIDALVEAAEPERARELVERYGVDVFAPTLSDTSAT
ncbi:MAG: hypothetical protein AAF211_20830 [Myxococcota bacterium]